MTSEEIAAYCARAAHAFNNVYCEAIGAPSSPEWIALSDAQRAGIIRGALFIINGGDPETNHDNWRRDRTDEGWTHGPKDFAAKTSPDLVPFGELPANQQRKSHNFASVVRAMAAALA